MQLSKGLSFDKLHLRALARGIATTTATGLKLLKDAKEFRPKTRAGIRNKAPPFKPSRGDSGHGWYKLYEEQGPDGFRLYRPPTPFSWEAGGGKSRRTHVFMDISIDRTEAGRIVIELADDIMPRTARNFSLLCQGQAEAGAVRSNPFTYRGSSFHRIMKGVGIVGGQVEGDPMRNHSAFASRFFADEGFFIPHSAAGLVSMVSAGVHRNASQFYISTQPCPHLDGRSVVCGRVIRGLDVVQGILSTYSIRGRPVARVLIRDSGLEKAPT